MSVVVLSLSFSLKEFEEDENLLDDDLPEVEVSIGRVSIVKSSSSSSGRVLVEIHAGDLVEIHIFSFLSFTVWLCNIVPLSFIILFGILFELSLLEYAVVAFGNKLLPLSRQIFETMLRVCFVVSQVIRIAKANVHRDQSTVLSPFPQRMCEAILCSTLQWRLSIVLSIMLLPEKGENGEQKRIDAHKIHNGNKFREQKFISQLITFNDAVKTSEKGSE